jgi:hypothetical protein
LDWRFSISPNTRHPFNRKSKIEILEKGVNPMSREQIRKLTSLSSCAG